MSGQAVYAANHKQWSDSLVLTEDGRFWRTAGFRGWSETSKSAGRWESAGNELTLTWFEWGPEHLASRDGGRTFECTKGYQFTLRLPPADGVPGWLFRGHSQEQTVAEVRRLLRAELEALREARGEPEPPRAAELLADLSRGLRPFAAALHASGHPAPAQLKHAFEAVGWDVRKNKSLEGSGPLVVVNKFLPAGFRYALYGLFGIVGGAGVGIAASQGKMDDVALNGVGLVLAVGFAFLDVSASKGQVEEAKAVMRNENLALGTYAEDDSQESKSGAGRQRGRHGRRSSLRHHGPAGGGAHGAHDSTGVREGEYSAMPTFGRARKEPSVCHSRSSSRAGLYSPMRAPAAAPVPSSSSTRAR